MSSWGVLMQYDAVYDIVVGFNLILCINVLLVSFDVLPALGELLDVIISFLFHFVRCLPIRHLHCHRNLISLRSFLSQGPVPVPSPHSRNFSLLSQLRRWLQERCLASLVVSKGDVVIFGCCCFCLE